MLSFTRHKEKLANPKEKLQNIFQYKQRENTQMCIQNLPIPDIPKGNLPHPNDIKLENGVVVISEPKHTHEDEREDEQNCEQIGKDFDISEQEDEQTGTLKQNQSGLSVFRSTLSENKKWVEPIPLQKQNKTDSRTFFKKLGAAGLINSNQLAHALSHDELKNWSMIAKSLQVSMHGPSSNKASTLLVAEQWKKELVKQFRIARNSYGKNMNGGALLPVSTKKLCVPNLVKQSQLTPIASYDLNILKSDKWGQNNSGLNNVVAKPVLNPVAVAPPTPLSQRGVKKRDRSILNRNNASNLTFQLQS